LKKSVNFSGYPLIDSDVQIDNRSAMYKVKNIFKQQQRKPSFQLESHDADLDLDYEITANTYKSMEIMMTRDAKNKSRENAQQNIEKTKKMESRVSNFKRNRYSYKIYDPILSRLPAEITNIIEDPN
jgi:hypothetical protein